MFVFRIFGLLDSLRYMDWDMVDGNRVLVVFAVSVDFPEFVRHSFQACCDAVLGPVSR
jgi:hypothetical protein